MKTESGSLPETGFIRLPEILKLVPVCRATWWNWVKSGRAPQGIKLSSRVTAWRVEDIKAFIQGGAQ
jgi:prophage regulatory protein